MSLVNIPRRSRGAASAPLLGALPGLGSPLALTRCRIVLSCGRFSGGLSSVAGLPFLSRVCSVRFSFLLSHKMV